MDPLLGHAGASRALQWSAVHMPTVLDLGQLALLIPCNARRVVVARCWDTTELKAADCRGVQVGLHGKGLLTAEEAAELFSTYLEGTMGIGRHLSPKAFCKGWLPR